MVQKHCARLSSVQEGIPVLSTWLDSAHTLLQRWPKEPLASRVAIAGAVRTALEGLARSPGCSAHSLPAVEGVVAAVHLLLESAADRAVALEKDCPDTLQIALSGFATAIDALTPRGGADVATDGVFSKLAACFASLQRLLSSCLRAEELEQATGARLVQIALQAVSRTTPLPPSSAPQSARWSGRAAPAPPRALSRAGEESSGESEGEGGDARAALRLAALNSLMAGVRLRKPIFRSSWMVLFEERMPDQTGPSTSGTNSSSLLNLLRYDPAPRVRQAAAALAEALFEGPAQRSYLRVASTGQGTTSFVPLSEQLGRLVERLHAAFLQLALRTERNPRAAGAILRALSALSLGTPYGSLDARLFATTTEVIERGEGYLMRGWFTHVATVDDSVRGTNEQAGRLCSKKIELFGTST